MSRHTPGPWTYEVDNRTGLWRVVHDHEFNDAKYRCLVAGNVSFGYQKYVTDNSEAMETCEANARMIASAPELCSVVSDMLAGFRYVRQRMASGAEDPWYGFGIERLEQTGAAAIAKAVGTDA